MEPLIQVPSKGCSGSCRLLEGSWGKGVPGGLPGGGVTSCPFWKQGRSPGAAWETWRIQISGLAAVRTTGCFSLTKVHDNPWMPDVLPLLSSPTPASSDIHVHSKDIFHRHPNLSLYHLFPDFMALSSLRNLLLFQACACPSILSLLCLGVRVGGASLTARSSRGQQGPGQAC